MSVDAATVRRIAHLARIAVAESEVPLLQGELNAMLAFVEQLSEVNVDGVEPMTSVMPMEMKKRPDVVTDGEILSREEKGVRCNVIAPGFMDTPMGRDASRRRADRAVTAPFGRQGTGWEVAYAALFLISNESSYINAQTLFLDGGHLAGIVRASPAISE